MTDDLINAGVSNVLGNSGNTIEQEIQSIVDENTTEPTILDEIGEFVKETAGEIADLGKEVVAVVKSII